MATSPCSTPTTGTAAGPATAQSAEVTRARTCTFFFFFFYGCACEGAGWKACRVELAVVHLPAMAIIALMVQIG